MLEFFACLRGVAAIQGAAIAGATKAIDINRLTALSGPLATSLGTLADQDLRTAFVLIGSAILARITASTLAARGTKNQDDAPASSPTVIGLSGGRTRK